jgi:2'-hydroxyisoflavone reductase
VLTLPPGLKLTDIKKIDDNLYGPLKALAEQAAETAMPGRATCVRAGLLVGPGDPTDRFTYWPVRLARGGEMAAPGTPEDPMQFVDVRDLGAWMIRVIEEHTTGVFNVVGPEVQKFGAVLDACKRGVGSDARFTWIDQAWLEKNKLSGWGSFPVHVSPSDDECGFARVSAAKAIAKGLQFRRVEETAKDTLAFWNSLSEERRAKERPGLTAEKEAQVLAQWREEHR